MLGSNNQKEIAKRTVDKNARYAIKRLGIGVASVAVATALSFTGSNKVLAEESNTNQLILSDVDNSVVVEVPDAVVSNKENTADNAGQESSSQSDVELDTEEIATQENNNVTSSQNDVSSISSEEKQSEVSNKTNSSTKEKRETKILPDGRVLVKAPAPSGVLHVESTMVTIDEVKAQLAAEAKEAAKKYDENEVRYTKNGQIMTRVKPRYLADVPETKADATDTKSNSNTVSVQEDSDEDVLMDIVNDLTQPKQQIMTFSASLDSTEEESVQEKSDTETIAEVKSDEIVSNDTTSSTNSDEPESFVIPELTPGFRVKEENFDEYPKRVTLDSGEEVVFQLYTGEPVTMAMDVMNIFVYPEDFVMPVMDLPSGEMAKISQEDVQAILNGTYKGQPGPEPVVIAPTQQGAPLPEDGQTYPIPVGTPGKGNIPEDGLSATFEAECTQDKVIDKYGYRYIDNGYGIDPLDENGNRIQTKETFIREGRDYSLENQQQQIQALDNGGEVIPLRVLKYEEIQRIDNPGEYEPLTERSYSWDLTNYDPDAYYIINIDGQRVKTYEYDPAKDELYDKTSRGYVQVYYPNAFILEKPADGDIYRAEDGEIITAEIEPTENGQILSLVVNRIDRTDGTPRHVREILSFLLPNGVDSDTSDDEGNPVPAQPISYIEGLVVVNKDNFADEALAEMIFETQIGISPLYEFDSSIRPVAVLDPSRVGDDVVYTEYELIDKNLDEDEFTHPDYDQLIEEYSSKEFWELNHRTTSKDKFKYREYPNGYRMISTGIDVLGDTASRTEDKFGNITLQFQNEDGYRYELTPYRDWNAHYIMKTYDSEDNLVKYTNGYGNEQNFRYAFIEPNTNEGAIFKSKIYIYLDDYVPASDEENNSSEIKLDLESGISLRSMPTNYSSGVDGHLWTAENGKDFNNPPGIDGNEIKIETTFAQYPDNNGVLRDGLDYRILTRQINSVDGTWTLMLEFFVPDGMPASNLDVKHRYITRELDVNGNEIDYRDSTVVEPTVRKIVGNTYSVQSKPKDTYELTTINGATNGTFKPRQDEQVEFIYERGRQQGQVNVSHKFYLVTKNTKGEIVKRELVEVINEDPRVEFNVQEDYETPNSYEVTALTGEKLPQEYTFTGDTPSRSGEYVGGQVVNVVFVYEREVIQVEDPATPPETPNPTPETPETPKPTTETPESPKPTQTTIKTPTPTQVKAEPTTPEVVPVKEETVKPTDPAQVVAKTDSAQPEVSKAAAPAEVLPETGETTSLFSAAVVSILSGLGLVTLRKRKDD